MVSHRHWGKCKWEKLTKKQTFQAIVACSSEGYAIDSINSYKFEA